MKRAPRKRRKQRKAKIVFRAPGIRDALWLVIPSDPFRYAKQLQIGDAFEMALRSAVRAALPGRQQKRNLEAPLALAQAAFVRTLKRRAKQRTSTR